MAMRQYRLFSSRISKCPGLYRSPHSSWRCIHVIKCCFHMMCKVYETFPPSLMFGVCQPTGLRLSFVADASIYSNSYMSAVSQYPPSSHPALSSLSAPLRRPYRRWVPSDQTVSAPPGWPGSAARPGRRPPAWLSVLEARARAEASVSIRPRYGRAAAGSVGVRQRRQRRRGGSGPRWWSRLTCGPERPGTGRPGWAPSGAPERWPDAGEETLLARARRPTCRHSPGGESADPVVVLEGM